MPDRLMQFLFYPAGQKIRFKCAFGLYFLIVVLGTIPGVRAEAGEFASGLVLHSLAYSTIAYLLFTGMRVQSFMNALASWLLIALMGAFDEFVQSFFPYRRASVNDWIVDITAALVMLGFLLAVWPALQKAVNAQRS